MSDEPEHGYIAVARSLKRPPTARQEITEHIESLGALIGRHLDANHELLARVTEREQVIAGLKALRADYARLLTHLPEPAPGLTGLSAADLADLDALTEGPIAADPQEDTTP